MKNKICFAISLLFLMSGCITTIDDVRKDAVERLTKRAEKHITYMKNLNDLVNKHGTREEYPRARMDKTDKNLPSVLQLAAADKEMFEIVGADDNYETRYKDVDYSPTIHNLLILDCNEKPTNKRDTIHYDLSDLVTIDIGNYTNAFIITGLYEKDFFLSMDEAREYIEKYIQEWEGIDTTGSHYSEAKHPALSMEHLHNTYKYLAIIRTVYYIEPVIVGDSFNPGFLKRHVIIYDIETGKQNTEFDVIATNSSKAHSFFSDNPALENLFYIYEHELFYQLKKAGIK